MNNYWKNKGLGFYSAILGEILAVVTLIVYTSHYGHGPLEANIDSMSWTAFAFLTAGVVLTAGLIALKRYFWASVLQASCFFVAFLLFVYGVYPYISVVAVGIDIQELSAGFLWSTILYVLTLIVSVIGIFARAEKE